MTRTELRTVNELSKMLDIFTKNEQTLWPFTTRLDEPQIENGETTYDPLSDPKEDIHIKTISITCHIQGKYHSITLDIDSVSIEGHRRIIDTIYLEIESRHKELEKEFDSLKIMKDE